MKAYRKDIWRAITTEKKRFFSIMLITVLGVTMLSGLRAACQDLRYSADTFYDAQHLYDISVMSALGLTQEDIEALEQVPDAACVEGSYSVTVYTKAADHNRSVELKALSQKGINEPYLMEGTLPQDKTEIAVSKSYMDDTGKKLGDTVEIEEEETDKEDTVHVTQTSFTISAIVTDVCDVNSQSGAVSFRSNSSKDYTFFVLPEVIDSDVYTVAYLTVKDTESLNCYQTDYENRIKEVIRYIDRNISEDREQARYDKITGDAYAEIEDARAEAEEELADARKEVENGRKELEDGKNQIEDALAELEQAKAMMSQAMYEASLTQIKEQQAQIDESEKEIEEAEETLKEETEKLEKEITDAKEEVAQIEMPVWYIQDRSALSGYTNVKTDADCIQSVGTAFPIIFLAVAVLISLTTITRMVEEERGLIGTYKALGFTDGEIRRKYVIYAALASICGGIFGDLCGYLLLPRIIFFIFQTMYSLPQYLYTFDALYGFGGIALFAVGIIGATIIACEAELSHMPAKLMRPKAPKSGSRVFLERISFIWNKLSFLNKVTARNLFRYKKRLFMTIGGIMGCTALVLCGFVIKDAVTNLLVGQYQDIYQYDALIVTNEDDLQHIRTDLQEETTSKSQMELRVESVKLVNSEGKESEVQLMVVPTGSSLSDYIQLEDEKKNLLELKEGDIFVTINASKLLSFEEGDSIYLQTLDLVQKEITVTDIVLNYMGNSCYMTQETYEELYGDMESNAILAKFSMEDAEQITYTDELGKRDGVLSVVSIAKMKDEFQIAFTLINMVVYIIIIMAAGLALVVLFTLSTTNISERERELATIKVLGFFDKEVHLYVNKETMILTGIGVILGLPLGKWLGGMLTEALEMPSIYFAIDVQPISYVLSAALSLCFAFIVNMLTNRTLNQIDPVEALKSIE